MKNVEKDEEFIKKSKDMREKYLKKYPKQPQPKGCMFEFYVGRNNKKIKGKNLKSLNYSVIDELFNEIFIENKYEDFWNDISNDVIVYLWGSSFLIDTKKDFYYQLRLEQHIINYYISGMDNKIKINKLNLDNKNIDKDYEFDIIIL